MVDRLLLSLENAAISFGGKPLFEELNLHITEGDKICLIGKNGAGKTTLMKLITGELEQDGGKRFCLNGITIGYLAQSIDFHPDDSIHAFVMSGLEKDAQSEDRHHLADKVIYPLDLDPAAPMRTLSGGQVRRAALARALILEPDILLLDEPTNHLDLRAIEWLEQYLASYRGALICVSHDRAFLAAISQKVFWLDRGTIRICPRGYAHFEEWSEKIIEQEARELHNEQKKLAAELDWTQGGVSGRRKRNQRRLRELHALREKIRTDKAAYNERVNRIDVDTLTPVQRSKIVAEFEHVHMAYRRDGTTLPILEDFDFRILRGDKIGILGHNGSGKSTFIKLLVGELSPDKGRIFRGKTNDIAYFDQNRSELHPEKTVWDTLAPDGGDYVFIGADRDRPVHVCGYLKRFLFDPRIARDRISTLSGGQQNRLMLARLLTKPGNVLILDEPTNDLDMDTLDMLQEMLADYQGTLIIVSHDRDFLDRTVTEILAFEGETKIEHFIGGYSDYHNAKKRRVVSSPQAETKKQKKSSGRASSAKQRMSGKERHELEKLPEHIRALENEIIELNDTLADPSLYSKNPERFDTTSRRLPKAQAELDAAELRWLELEEKRQKYEGGES